MTEMVLSKAIGVFCFIFGTVIASFLNVVIWRVPRGESIVKPASHCPKCNAEIKWYQNIPIISYLMLRGKCANCKTGISPRYVLVEMLGGFLFWAAYWRFGVYAPIMWVWIALMIIGSFIDFDYKLLPDFVTIGGMIYGLVLAGVNWGLTGELGAVFDSLGGLALGFGLLMLIRILGEKAFKREAMGLGDVFLMGAVGAIFGPVAVIFSLILSSFLGSIVGVAMILVSKAKIGKQIEIPYGPYICMANLVWMFYGPKLADWYLGLLR